MPSKIRRFTIKVLVAINVFIALLFLLSCLAPYLHPDKYWFVSLLGLGFAGLLISLVLMFFFWLIFQPKYSLICLIPLLIGWKSISVFFAANAISEYNFTKDPKHIRVASWNVARFIELSRNNNKGSQTRLKMMELLKQQDADVVCLQEFQTSTKPEYYDNIAYIQKNLGYKYFYFDFREDGNRLFYSSIIFSRYPIISSGVVHYPRPTIPEALIHADIKIGRDTIRFYSTHFQSVQFKQEDYEKIDEITRQQDSILQNSRSIFSKLKWGVIYRSTQADMVKTLLNDAPYPIVFCADLNDVPNSYAYFTTRGTMQDAFLEKGFGVGRTFSSLSPTLRIDYIFATDHFKIRQFNREVKNYSDHYLLVADLELKK